MTRSRLDEAFAEPHPWGAGAPHPPTPPPPPPLHQPTAVHPVVAGEEDPEEEEPDRMETPIQPPTPPRYIDPEADSTDWIDDVLNKLNTSMWQNTQPVNQLTEEEEGRHYETKGKPQQDKKDTEQAFDDMLELHTRIGDIKKTWTYSYEDWQTYLPPRRKNIWIAELKRTLWRRQEERVIEILERRDGIRVEEDGTWLYFSDFVEHGYYYNDEEKRRNAAQMVLNTNGIHKATQVYPRNYGVLQRRAVITTSLALKSFQTWLSYLGDLGRRLIPVTNYRHRSFVHSMMVACRGVYGFPKYPDFSSIYGTMRALGLTDDRPPVLLRGVEVCLARRWHIPTVLYLPVNNKPDELRVLITTPHLVPTTAGGWMRDCDQVWLTLSPSATVVPPREWLTVKEGDEHNPPQRLPLNDTLRDAVKAWLAYVFQQYFRLQLTPDQLEDLRQLDLIRTLLYNPYWISMVQLNGHFYPFVFNDPIEAIQQHHANMIQFDPSVEVVEPQKYMDNSLPLDAPAPPQPEVEGTAVPVGVVMPVVPQPNTRVAALAPPTVVDEDVKEVKKEKKQDPAPAQPPSLPSSPPPPQPAPPPAPQSAPAAAVEVITARFSPDPPPKQPTPAPPAAPPSPPKPPTPPKQPSPPPTPSPVSDGTVALLPLSPEPDLYDKTPPPEPGQQPYDPEAPTADRQSPSPPPEAYELKRLEDLTEAQAELLLKKYGDESFQIPARKKDRKEALEKVLTTINQKRSSLGEYIGRALYLCTQRILLDDDGYINRACPPFAASLETLQKLLRDSRR